MKQTKGHGYFRKSKAYGLVCSIAIGTALLFGGGVVNADETAVNTNTPQTEQVAKATEAKQESKTIEQVQQNIDKSQSDLKETVKTAQKSNVEVTEEETKTVTVTEDTAKEKEKEIVADLASQKEQVEQATKTQAENEKAYTETKEQLEEVVKTGQETQNEANTRQDQAIAEAEKAGVKVTVKTEKSNPAYINVKGLEGQALREAMEKNIALYNQAVLDSAVATDESTEKLNQSVANQVENDKAYEETKADLDQAIKAGNTSLNEANTRQDQAVATAKKAGVKVTSSTTTKTPNYIDITGLEGEALREAMAKNIALYNQAVKDSVAQTDKSTADVKKATTTQQANDKAYKDAKSSLDKATKAGQKTISDANSRQNKVIADAKKAGVTVTTKTTTVSPKYVNTKGLEGKALTTAMNKNVATYNKEVNSAKSKTDASTKSLQTKLNDYKKKISAYNQKLKDWNSGKLTTLSGIKWKSGTTVSGGTGAKKMTGNEKISGVGNNAKETASIAIQGANKTQNKDAKFTNIFKLSKSGTVTIKNTTNGDVKLTISNVKTTGKSAGNYLAVWGANNGGIAWGVFALYDGTATSGASGEGASGGNIAVANGRILNYVKSFDWKVSTTKTVSTFTYNDIDNDQTVTIKGAKGTLKKGKNVKQSGNKFSAKAGDVSQGSRGKIDSNGVQYNMSSAQKITISGTHSTSKKNTSIVAGVFGVSSEVKPPKPKKPTAPKLTATRYAVKAPQAPTKPKQRTVKALKVKVTPPQQPSKPSHHDFQAIRYEVTPPQAPEQPKAQEVSVHYYKLLSKENPQEPKPLKEAPVPQVQKSSSLPMTGEENSGFLSVIGAVIVGALGLTAFRKKDHIE